jgi:hypothetical protein
MATYTNNYNLKKPTYAESANVMVINENMDKVDEIMHSSQVSLADAYDLNSTYNTGDKVMYEKLMYKCKEDGVTGAWDASKWKRTTAVEGSGGSADFDIYGEASGTAEASFLDGAEASLVECEIGIVPTQDLHGYSKPWAGGAGKNKLPNTQGNESKNGVTCTKNSDGTYKFTGTASASSYFIVGQVNIPAGTYTLSGCPTGGGSSTYRLYFESPIGVNDTGSGASFTISEQTQCNAVIVIVNGCILPNEGIIFEPMVRLSTESNTFEPYSNICPISGHTDVTVTVASTSGGSGDDTTVSLGRTVYGGSLDVTTGVLTDGDGTPLLFNSANTNVWSGTATSTQGVTRFYTTPSYAGRELVMSDTYKISPNYATETDIITMSNDGRIIITPTFGQGKTLNEFKALLADNPFNVLMTLATPQTYNLTPTQVLTLLGQNYVSHDGGGTISLVYVKRDAPIKPNPADAEIPLTGLEINGEKFKIESGGYHKALIWDSGSPTIGASYATDYALLDNLSNYDQIILMVSTNGDRADANHQYSYQIWLDVEYLLSSGAWHNANVSGYGTRYFEASFTDSSFRIIQGGGEGGYTPTIFQIYGVRY